MALPTTRNHGGGARGLAQGPGREGGAVMTIERPMFPPRADAAVSCEIIQFSAIAGLSKKDRKQIARAAGTSRMSRVEQQEPERLARDEGELSTTAQNG